MPREREGGKPQELIQASELAVGLEDQLAGQSEGEEEIFLSKVLPAGLGVTFPWDRLTGEKISFILCTRSPDNETET